MGWDFAGPGLARSSTMPHKRASRLSWAGATPRSDTGGVPCSSHRGPRRCVPAARRMFVRCVGSVRDRLERWQSGCFEPGPRDWRLGRRRVAGRASSERREGPDRQRLRAPERGPGPIDVYAAPWAGDGDNPLLSVPYGTVSEYFDPTVSDDAGDMFLSMYWAGTKGNAAS